MNLKVLPTDRAQICLLFYKPTVSDPFQNKLVSFFDGPFCHVEMAFLERFGEELWEKDVWGSSIYQGETVFFKPKTYKRDGYVSFGIEVTVNQMHKVRSYCRQQTESKVPFCIRSMYAAYLPFQLMNTEATFCSKHVASALQYGGVYNNIGLNPALTTPSKLYRLLTQHSPILQVVPSRMVPENSNICSAKMVKDMVNKNRYFAM
jgi:hypothetical protein